MSAINNLSGAVIDLRTEQNQLNRIVSGDPRNPLSIGLVKLVYVIVGLLISGIGTMIGSLYMQYLTIQKANFSGKAAIVNQQLSRDVKEATEETAEAVEEIQKTIDRKIVPRISPSAPKAKPRAPVKKSRPPPEPERRWWDVFRHAS